MIEKTCPYCKNKSYSASTKGDWVCPYCKKLLTQFLNRILKKKKEKEDNPNSK